MARLANLGRLVLGLASLAAVLWSSVVVAAGPPKAVKIALPPFYSSALAYIAAHQGLWKEEGLEVTLLSFAGGPMVNEAVLSGSVEFGMGVGVGPAVALASRNARIVVIASEAYTDGTSPPELLVVRKDSPVTDVKQLDGKKVAIHAKGTLGHVLIEAISRRFGIKPILLEIPSPSMWVALSRGDIDAVFIETPFPEQMKAQGGRYLYGLPNKDVVPYLAATVTLTTREFAEKNPETVQQVVKVIIRTARWIMDNPEKARNIISDRLRYTPEVTQLIHPQSFKWSRNAAHTMPSIRWWGQQMQSLNLIQQQPNYEQYFVTTHVDAVLKDLRRVPDPDYEKTIAISLPQR